MRSGLIISSEKGITETCNLILGDIATIKVAGSVQEGIKEIVTFPASFVILDSHLKDLNPVAGLEKLLQIQKILPVMVLVPSIHSPLVDDLKKAGAYAVIEKPFAPKAILDIVERAIERHQLMKEIEFLKEWGARTSGETHYPQSKTNQYYYHEVLRRFSKAISQVFDHKKLLDLATEALVETFNASKAIILLPDQRSGKYLPISFTGYPQQFISSLTLDPTDDLPAWLSKHNQIILAHGLSGTLQFGLHQQVESLKAEIIIGLFAQGKLIGILTLGKKITGKSYFEDDLELLSILSNYLAVAIENASLYRNIARNRAHNEKVLNSLRTGVVTIDSRGLVTTFNRAAESILELKCEEVTGEKVEKLGSQFADIMLCTLAGKAEYQRYEIASPVQKKPLGISTSTMRDEKKNIDGAIMVFADLSGVKKLEEKAKDLERREFWTRMASRLTHEVKNLLVPIKTFAQLLPQRYGDRSFREEFFEIVTREIDRLNDIVEQITKLAESPQPKKKIDDIHKAIEIALDTLATKIESKNARVVRKFSQEKLAGAVDTALLSESFAGIIDNALDAIEEKGTITITTDLKRPPSGSDGIMGIIFQDEGRGMDQEELKNIFTPFITSKINGMGLGLPIAQQIIKDHHGSLEVTSSSGKGTSVKVLIPLRAE